MTSNAPTATAAPEVSSGSAFEPRLREEQLRIIERTSLPGVLSSVIGIGALLLFAAQPGYEHMRNALLGIDVCVALMAVLWAFSLRACRNDDLVGALLGQMMANLIGTVLFFVFIERGAILAVFTTLVAVSAGAMVFDDRRQRRVTILGTTVILVSAAVAEAGWVEPIALPPVILYVAVVVTLVFGLRTPISAFRMFTQHVQRSRIEALRNEQAAREARDRADAQTRELESLSAELREFMYVVSHDLRAPLINIEGFGNVLREALENFDERAGQLDSADPVARSWTETHAEVVEALHFIASGTKKMDALIKGLLVLSRIDNGPIQQEKISLPVLVEEIVSAMEHQIRDRAVSVEIGELPEIVGEKLRVSQVFGNLIDNAVKYMPDREPRRIAVSCEETDEAFVFAVSDSGDGIAPEARQKIFRLFKRLDPSSTAAGDGIGLAAVRKIIERHGGRVWVEDGLDGLGASFRFTWPRRPHVQSVPDDRDRVAA